MKPEMPPENSVISAHHPWAKHWIGVAMDACKANGAKWRTPQRSTVSLDSTHQTTSTIARLPTGTRAERSAAKAVRGTT